MVCCAIAPTAYFAPSRPPQRHLFEPCRLLIGLASLVHSRPSSTCKGLLTGRQTPEHVAEIQSNWAPVCVASKIAARPVAANEPDLEIHNTFKPESCERKAQATDMLTLHYKGTLQSGQVFDSSYERGETLHFQLGVGHVIPGWDRGLIGTCAGEKIKLVVPPSLGYGEMKHDHIPPGSTLVFEIELLKVEVGPKPVNVFKEIDANDDGRLTRKEVGEYLRKSMKQAQQHGDPATREDPDYNHMVDEIFMHEDKDKDEYITHDEFSGPKIDHDEL